MHCPVKRLHEYLNSLPRETKDNSLFPKFNGKQNKFSSFQVLGKDKLGNLMSDLSQNASLSRRYTNHSIRVTGINYTYMHESGMTNEEIASITGHKTTKSVQHYIRKNGKKILHASNVLSNISEPDEAISISFNEETISCMSSGNSKKHLSSEREESESEQKVIKIYNPSNCTFNF